MYHKEKKTYRSTHQKLQHNQATFELFLNHDALYSVKDFLQIQWQLEFKERKSIDQRKSKLL